MTSQITKDFQMKSKLRKLADGGSRGEGGGLSKEAVMAAIAAQRGTPTPAPAPAPAPAPVVVQRPGGDYLRNPRSVIGARERAAGLADGGSVPFGSRGLSGLRDLIPQMEAMGFRQQPAQPDPTGLRAVMPRVKAMGYMDGGRVEGPGGRTDDEVGPVMLSDEEYVLPGDTADAIGRDNLDAIRLATHEFKDEHKESKLRKAHGLADGGSPWIADAAGNVRKPNAFGDAAAGSNYTQPKLPPPQAGSAVATQALPIGQRPPIDITPPGSRTPPAAQVVDAVTDVAPKTAMSRAGSALRGAARVGAPVAGIAGAAQSFDDQSTGYRDHFQNSVGAESPLGSVAADAARVLSNVGDAALFGLPGRLGRGIAGALGGEDAFSKGSLVEGLSAMGRNAGRFVDGFLSPSDRDTFEQNRMDKVIGGGATGSQPSPVTATASALRSDQGPALPVEPGSYQSRRLSEMGVPLDVQNSKPVVDSATGSTREFLRTGGTSQYQNLGTYGGNGNIYGKADDPSRPGRINNFVGVGAGASPSNEFNGSGSGGGSTSALRGLGKGPSSPGGSGDNNAPADNSAAINARYDKLAKQLSGMYGPKGQGNLARRLLELEHSRSGALDADARNVTSRSNAALHSSTLRDNAQLEALGRMEQSRATALSQAQAAQLKALQDAQKLAREGEEKGFDRYTGAIGQMFTVKDKDGKQTVDKAAQERFRAFIEGSDPKAGEKFAAMSPQQQQVLLQNFKTMFDMNEARNKTAQSGSWPSDTGGVTNRMDMPVDVREATWNDYWNNNLPLKDYLWSNLPGTNRNVVVTESGQPTLYSDYTSTGGERDLDKEKIVQDSVKARRSSLRSN